MKKTLTTLSITLFSLAFYGAATATLQAQAPQKQAESFDIHGVETRHVSPDPDDPESIELTTYNDEDYAFFRFVRAWRGPEQRRAYNDVVGWDNQAGWFTMEQRYIAYFTDLVDGVPRGVDVYSWSKRMSFNGEEEWIASYAHTDLTTGTASGFGWSFASDNIFSPITGAVELSLFNRDGKSYVDGIGWHLNAVAQ